MSGAVKITRTDLTAAELRRAARKSRDAKAARRMLAIALVPERVDRKTAAETCGMDRQTVRDWVHRPPTIPVLSASPTRAAQVTKQGNRLRAFTRFGR